MRMRKLGLEGIALADQARSTITESVKAALNEMDASMLRACLAEVQRIEKQASGMEPALSVIVNLGILSFESILAEWLASSEDVA